MVILTDRYLGLLLLMDTLDFRLNSSGFLTPFPDVEPIFSL